jgi:glutamate-1-semialdehyde aminotransferase
MSIPEAQELVAEGIFLQTNWVGAEPYFFTQAAARKGYLMATYDAEYAAYVGGIMQEGGGHRQRKVRAAVNL